MYYEMACVHVHVRIPSVSAFSNYVPLTLRIIHGQFIALFRHKHAQMCV